MQIFAIFIPVVRSTERNIKLFLSSGVRSKSSVVLKFFFYVIELHLKIIKTMVIEISLVFQYCKRRIYLVVLICRIEINETVNKLMLFTLSQRSKNGE